jgi:hypothetical protein
MAQVIILFSIQPFLISCNWGDASVDETCDAFPNMPVMLRSWHGPYEKRAANTAHYYKYLHSKTYMTHPVPSKNI